MKFGVREICDVVFRAKSARRIGSRQFFKNEPVLYFDTLKTSTLEGAVTTVYAQGGRGNARLVAWDGERTLTFTMEDALISDIGLAILASADLIEANETKSINVHATSVIAKEKIVNKIIDMSDVKDYIYDPYHPVELKEVTEGETAVKKLQRGEAAEDSKPEFAIYVMLMKNGEVFTEPYLATVTGEPGAQKITIEANDTYTPGPSSLADELADAEQVLVDYYVIKTGGVTQVDIAPETFGGNFYIEASTLFRDQVSGIDMPAEFIIPNGKVQSNFTFTMASSGDPSTFTFTVEALPDYTRFNPNKKVLAAIQVITDESEGAETSRNQTDFDYKA